VLDVLCERPQKGKAPGKQNFEVSFGYRSLPLSRHFVGTVEQKQREVLGNQIQNFTHIMDFSLSYQVTKRFSLNTAIPFMRTWRNQLYIPTGVFSNFAQGDATVGGRYWLFRPPTESRRNIGIGMAVKLPTGRYNLTGNVRDRNGNAIIATADQSIQPGDGRTGFVLDINTYTPSYFRRFLYFQGTYYSAPRTRMEFPLSERGEAKEYFQSPISISIVVE